MVTASKSMSVLLLFLLLASAVGPFVAGKGADQLVGDDQEVLAGYQEIKYLVGGADLKKGTRQSLLASLESSEEAYVRGSFKAAVNKLEAFKNKVSAQLGGVKTPHMKMAAPVSDGLSELGELLLSKTNLLETGIEMEYMTVVRIGITYADADADSYVTDLDTIADLAYEDANCYSRDLGSDYRFEYVFLDNDGSDQAALDNTVAFDEAGVNLVLGHGWSSQCLSSLGYANENGVLLFSESSTSPLLCADDNLYRLAPVDGIQGEVLADLYQDLGIRAVGILYFDHFWSRSVDSVLEQRCAELGIDVVASRVYSGDLYSQMASIEDALEGSGYSADETAFQLLTLSDAPQALNMASLFPTLSRVTWFGCDFNSDIGLSGSEAEVASSVRLYSPSPAPGYDDPAFTSLQDRYRAITGRDLHYYEATSYDILMIYAKAVIQADGTDTEAVRAAIETITVGYNGVSGTSTIDGNGDRRGADFDVWGWGWDDGRSVMRKYGFYDYEADSLTLYPFEEEPPEPVNDIRIGITYSSGFSNQYFTAAELAREDINDWCIESGLNFRFDFTYLDNQGSAEVALANMETFHEAGIDLVVGHGWSSQCMASLDYVDQNGMLLFSQSSTSPLLALDDNLYRLTTNDIVQGKVIVDLYKKLGVRGIVVLYRDDVYGQGIKSVIDELCPAEGIEVLGAESYNPSNFDFPTHMARLEAILAASGYQRDELAFQLVSFDEGSQPLNIASGYPNIYDVKWVGCDSTSMLIYLAGKETVTASKVTLYSPMVAPEWDKPSFIALQERYRPLSGIDLQFYPAAMYDILQIYAKAVVQAGGTGTEAVRAAIESIVVDYDGVSGTSTLDANGDRIGANYDVWGYGWENGQHVNRRYGYFDLAADDVVLYDIAEQPPELTLFGADMWSYMRYDIGNQEGSTRYQVATRVTVFDKDGLADVTSVKIVTSLGEFELIDDVEKWGFQPNDGEYFNECTFDQIPGAIYQFVATDSQGHVATLDYNYNGWATTKFDSVSPGQEELIPSSQALAFGWTTTLGDIDAFVVQLSDWKGFNWARETRSGNQIVYDGPELPEGLYHYDLYARSMHRGEVVAHVDFYIGSELQLIDPGIWSTTWRSLEHPEQPPYFTLTSWTRLYSQSGEVDSVRVIYPDGVTVVEMPWRGDAYINWRDVQLPLIGNFTIEAQLGNLTITKIIAVDESLYNNAVVTPVSPTFGQLFTSSDELLFDFSTTLEGVDWYNIGIWNETFGHNIFTRSLPVGWDGYEPLDPGRYWFNVVAGTDGEHHETGIYGCFYIGSDIQLLNPQVWVTTWYNYETPNASKYYTLNLWTMVLGALPEPSPLFVYLPPPMGLGLTVLERQQDGTYYRGLDFSEPFGGDFRFHVTVGNQTDEKTVQLALDGYSPYQMVPESPINGQRIATDDELFFNWSTNTPDAQYYDVYVWNQTGYVWSCGSPTLPITYTGEHLKDGLYYVNMHVSTASKRDIGAHVAFYIGNEWEQQTLSWVTSPNNLPVSLSLSSLVVNDEVIYLIGGQGPDGMSDRVFFSVIDADGQNGQWVETSSLPEPLCSRTNIAVICGDYLYVCGGAGLGGYQERSGVYYAHVNSDGSLDPWQTTTSLPDSVQSHVVVAWGGRIYIVGGWNGYSWLSGVWVADVQPDGSLGSWRPVNSLPIPMAHGQAGTVYNGVIYVSGGHYPDYVLHDTIYYGVVDQVSGDVTWSTASFGLPAAMEYHSMTVLNGEMYIIGGTDVTSVFDDVFHADVLLDGSLGLWVRDASIPEPRYIFSAGETGQWIYVIGGMSPTSSYSNTVYYAGLMNP